MMDTFQKGVIALIRSALFQTKEPIPQDLDWESLSKLTREHQIHAFIYYGVFHSAAQPPEEIRAVLETNAFKSFSASHNQTYAIHEIFRVFDQHGIAYMPLKGTVLKPLYPKPELRAMSDADVLIKPEQYDEIRPLIQQLGFTEGVESDHEYIWEKPGFLSLELHKRLIPSNNRDYYAYYGDGWQLAKPCGGCRYALSDEDLFVYLMTHFAKHYRDGGIGIRHFVDLYVYLSAKKELDASYIEKELKKLGLERFYRNVKKTAAVWFDGAAEDAVTDFITARIFNSGSYGTAEAHVVSVAVKDAKSSSTQKGAYCKRVWRLVFPTYRHMTISFPVLKKHPGWLPLFWVYRWFRAIFFRHENIAKLQGEMKIATMNRVETYQQELNFVGLDFNFKE